MDKLMYHYQKEIKDINKNSIKERELLKLIDQNSESNKFMSRMLVAP